MRFTIVEEASFTQQVAALGDVRLIDNALSGIVYTLASNPYTYKQFRGFPELRFATTPPTFWHGTYNPVLRVMFRIDDGAKRVHLLAISHVLPGEDDEQE